MPLFWSREKCDNASVSEKTENWVKSSHYCRGWQYIGAVHKIPIYHIYILYMAFEQPFMDPLKGTVISSLEF